MRIVALLSWYHEPASFLKRCIHSLNGVADHLVAVDGAYQLFPNGKARSPEQNYRAIRKAAMSTGIGLTIHTPDRPWQGNEIEKRDRMFRLAEHHDPDWYLVIDADEELVQPPADLRDQLATTTRDVASVRLVDAGTTGRHVNLPMFFRAIPGIQVKDRHYGYTTPDGRILWGDSDTRRAEPRLTLDMRVNHYTQRRPHQRQAQARAYYQDRERVQAEQHPCAHCPEPATRTVESGWALGPEGFSHGYSHVCPAHHATILLETQAFFDRVGITDPLALNALRWRMQQDAA
jgi:hypothetical protein